MPAQLSCPELGENLDFGGTIDAILVPSFPCERDWLERNVQLRTYLMRFLPWGPDAFEILHICQG